jgi:hypothetical protein
MIQEVFSVREDEERDPLLDAMGVLEATYVLAKDILSSTCRIYSRLFGIFFLKKRKAMPEHLGNLVKMLDTSEDPTLRLSWRRPRNILPR